MCPKLVGLAEAVSVAGFVFLAELGDKTMLSTAVLAARTRKFVTVLCVSTAAFFVANVVPVFAAWVFSGFVGSFVRWISAVLFIAIGVWFLVSRGDDKGDKYGLLSVFLSVLLAELGDKTQLTIVSCALIAGDPILAILSGTLGYTLANSVGVALAGIIGTKVSQRYLRLVSSTIFIAIGIYLLISAVMEVRFS